MKHSNKARVTTGEEIELQDLLFWWETNMPDICEHFTDVLSINLCVTLTVN